VRQEIGVEGRAEVAPPIGVFVIALAGCQDSVVVWLLEKDNPARDERDNFTIDRAV
jgi:hypothetical protein